VGDKLYTDTLILLDDESSVPFRPLFHYLHCSRAQRSEKDQTPIFVMNKKTAKITSKNK